MQNPLLLTLVEQAKVGKHLLNRTLNGLDF